MAKLTRDQTRSLRNVLSPETLFLFSETEGRDLDAKFSVEHTGDKTRICIHSSGGGTGDGPKTNPEYAAALTLLLRRLQTGGAVVHSIKLASTTIKERNELERQLSLDGYQFPIWFNGHEDLQMLQAAIWKASASAFREPNAKGLVHRLTAPILYFTLLAIAGRVNAQDSLSRVRKSWDQLPIFNAEYREDIDIIVAPKKEVAQSEVIYGGKDSSTTFKACVGPGRSKVTYAYAVDGRKEPAEEFLWKDNKFWTARDNGHTGTLSLKPHTLFNPLATGYIAYIAPVTPALKMGLTIVRETGDTVEMKDGRSTITGTLIRDSFPIRFRRFECSSQTTVNGKTSDLATVEEVKEEFEIDGYKFPRIVSRTLSKNGKVESVRTYTYIKRIPDSPKDGSIALVNGALVKDQDTEVVFTYKDGRLEENPLFKKEAAAEVTIKILALLTSIVGLCICSALIVRRRGRTIDTQIEK
jgi:hypothetical protein